MSADFGNRIRAIRDAYAEQVTAEQSFIAAWTGISNNVVRPVLLEARIEFAIKNASLTVKDENGEISLEFRTIPIGKSLRRLSYRPDRREGVIVLRADLDDGNKQDKVQIGDISTDLIEIHVEDFLKNALRLKA